MLYRTSLTIFLLISGIAQAAESIALPANFKLNGHNSATLSAEWWKWAMSSPEEINPVRDNTGEYCGVNQQGNIWFLAGGFGSSKIKRTCTIPANKYIYFPVINMSYWNRTEKGKFSCKSAIRNAAINNDTTLDLFVELDGAPLNNVKSHRARTARCFNIFERTPKELDPYNAFPSASDGYWIMLKPLKTGLHSLKFGGRYNKSSSALGHMVQDIEYEITVQ